MSQPTKEGPFVLFKSPFTSVARVSTGHPSLNAIVSQEDILLMILFYCLKTHEEGTLLSSFKYVKNSAKLHFNNLGKTSEISMVPNGTTAFNGAVSWKGYF